MVAAGSVEPLVSKQQRQGGKSPGPGIKTNMAGTLTPSEEAQLQQTIEMFEAITQSQPQDYQSLEILKEAYLKLSRDPEAVATSRRIAEAYVQLGQLSSAILEYETILQRFPGDTEVQEALAEIESRATGFGGDAGAEDDDRPAGEAQPEERSAQPGAARAAGKPQAGALDDGCNVLRRLFVDGKHINESEFDLCWPDEAMATNGNPVKPFIQELSDKNIMPVERSLKLLCDKSRLAYLPLEMYDINMDLARSYSAEVCRRWCVLPFDQLGKVVLVATSNPFNARAARELQDARPGRILWYLTSPNDLMREIKKAFR